MMGNYLGKKLKDYRMSNHLTQKELASKLYVSDKAVSKWELGNGYPDIETLKVLSQLLSISLDDLIRKEEPVPFVEYKSNRMVGQLPLYHVVIPKMNQMLDYSYKFPQQQPLTKQIQNMPKARGIICVGIDAKGILALGFYSRGIISVGILSVGIFALGLFNLGVLAMGILNTGIISIGNISLGLLALGNIGLAYVGIGNLMIGRYAIGNYGIGWQSFSLGNQFGSKEITAVFNELAPFRNGDWLLSSIISAYEANGLIWLFVLIGILLVTLILLGVWITKKQLTQGTH